jgi:hypothetical protein
VTTVAQHVTVALRNGGVSRVHGLSEDSLNGRADEQPDPFTTGVARRIIE